MTYKVELINVVKRYARNNPPVVPDLNLGISEGEFLCLLGPSGCGKTTTLRMIAGLEHISGGTVKIDGEVVDSIDEGIFVPPEKRKLGLVFQSYALWPHMTVRQNIEFGLKLRKFDSATIKQRIEEVTEKLAIAQYVDRYPNQLSGGQQQRVSLARMLAVNPSVLLLDEPLSNLDAKLRLDMRNELKRIHEEFGSTIIFVTHDQWEAMTLATRIALMKDGVLQQVSTPSEIYDTPNNRFVAEFVGALPINMLTSTQASKLLPGFNDASGKIDAVGIRPESLRLVKAESDGIATVQDVIPTGGSWITRIKTDGYELTAITDAAPELRGGDQVNVNVDPTKLLRFDADGASVPA